MVTVLGYPSLALLTLLPGSQGDQEEKVQAPEVALVYCPWSGLVAAFPTLACQTTHLNSRLGSKTKANI